MLKKVFLTTANVGLLLAAAIQPGCNDVAEKSECSADTDCKSAGEYCDLSVRQCKPRTCVPKTCATLGKQCGEWDDGCNTGHKITCPTCAGGNTCNADGQCVVVCTPDCGIRQCGPDPQGCGTSCGTCSDGAPCLASGTCETETCRQNGEPCTPCQGATDCCSGHCAPEGKCASPPDCGQTVTVSDLSASAITTNSAKISWHSPVAATCRIEFGLTTDYGRTTANEELSYFHVTELTGLSEKTTYHYRVRSYSPCGVETVSADQVFATRSVSELESTIKAARTDSGSPKTYYVKWDGDDGRDGLSPENAWQSPAYAASKADAGDAILLMDGTWSGERVVFARSGTDVAPITFKAQGGKPTLDGVDQTGFGIDTDGHSFITIEGLKITNYESALRLSTTGADAGNIAVRSCEISNSRLSGIEMWNFQWLNLVLLEGNTMDRNAIEAGDQDHGPSAVHISNARYAMFRGNTITNTNGSGFNGMHLHDSLIENNTIDKVGRVVSYYDKPTEGGPANVVIRGNRISNGTDRGIRFDYHTFGVFVLDNVIKNVPGSTLNIYPYSWWVVKGNYIENGGIFALSIVDTTFENNIWNCQGLAPTIAQGRSPERLPPNNNVVVKNNVFYGCQQVLLQTMTNSVVRNNIFLDSPLAVEDSAAPGDLVVDYNDFWNSPVSGVSTEAGHNLAIDPLFADPASGDFHLKSQGGRWTGSGWSADPTTSACLDAGDPTDDFCAEPQPNGGKIDLGAFGNTAQASKTPERRP